MNPEERRRAGRIIAARMAELGLSAADVASRAGVDPTTVRATVAGRRWPRDATRKRLAAALGWTEYEVARRTLEARQPPDAHACDLTDVPMADLLAELLRRTRLPGSGA